MKDTKSNVSYRAVLKKELDMYVFPNFFVPLNSEVTRNDQKEGYEW